MLEITLKAIVMLVMMTMIMIVRSDLTCNSGPLIFTMGKHYAQDVSIFAQLMRSFSFGGILLSYLPVVTV